MRWFERILLKGGRKVGIGDDLKTNDKVGIERMERGGARLGVCEFVCLFVLIIRPSPHKQTCMHDFAIDHGG